MPTDTLTLADLTAMAVAFRDERHWRPFHTPKNLASNLCIEAAELLEIFRWLSDEQASTHLQTPAGRQAFADELSDCFLTLLLLAYDQKLDLSVALKAKLPRIAQKYPVANPGNRRAGQGQTP